MIRILGAYAVAGLLALGSAQAADFGTKKPGPTLPVIAQFSWTGFYVGAQAGGRWGTDRSREYVTATGVFTGFQRSFDPAGYVAGLHGGYNRQFGRFVAGAEGDIEFSNYRGGHAAGFAIGIRSKSNLQGSLRARLGFLPMDRLMLYATGGVAFGSIRYTFFNGGLGLIEHNTKTRTGWTVGGGAEYAITNNILARVEYRYTDWGRNAYDSLVTFPGSTYRHHPRDHAVRGGVTYKF